MKVETNDDEPEDNAAISLKSVKWGNAIVTAGFLETFTQISKAVTAGVVAITGVTTLLGLLEIVVFSYQEPSGFPHFEPSSFAELLGPVALTGIFITSVLTILVGLPGYVFSLSRGDSQQVDVSARNQNKAQSEVEIEETELENLPADKCISHEKEPLIFFLVLAVEALLWYAINMYGTKIEIWMAKCSLLPLFNSALFQVSAFFFLPLPATLAITWMENRNSKRFALRWTARAIQISSGVLWLFPFLLVAAASVHSASSGVEFWVYIVPLTAVAAFGNAISPAKKLESRIAGALLIMAVLFIANPRVILGAPLRALGMIDARRIITIETDKREEFNVLTDSCKSISADDLIEQKQSAKPPLAPGPVARHKVFIENQLGKDIVLECNPPGNSRAWVTVPSELIFSREPWDAQ